MVDTSKFSDCLCLLSDLTHIFSLFVDQSTGSGSTAASQRHAAAVLSGVAVQTRVHALESAAEATSTVI